VGGVAATNGLLGGGGVGVGGLLRVGHGGALLGSSAAGLNSGRRGVLGTGLLRNPSQHR
jgi:hypothetical protein